MFLKLLIYWSLKNMVDVFFVSFHSEYSVSLYPLSLVIALLIDFSRIIY